MDCKTTRTRFRPRPRSRSSTRLSRSGLPMIEAASFVNPKAVPLMADAVEVMNGIERAPGVRYLALVPNEKGLDRALACGTDSIALFASASETFSQAQHQLHHRRIARSLCSGTGSRQGGRSLGARLYLHGIRLSLRRRHFPRSDSSPGKRPFDARM